MMRVHERESTMGSGSAVRRSNACRHVWIGWPAILFGYMPVDWRCVRCWTWAADPVDHDAPCAECGDEDEARLFDERVGAVRCWACMPEPNRHPVELLRLWSFSMAMMLIRLCGANAPDGHGDRPGGAIDGCLCRWCQARRLAEHEPIPGLDLLDPEVIRSYSANVKEPT